MSKLTKGSFDSQLLDDILSQVEDPQTVFSEEGLFNQLKKSLCERILEGELTDHLGYAKHSPSGKNSGNSRNGHREKRLLSEQGEVSLSMPRDRTGDFSPQLIRKDQRRFDGLDEQVISLYSRGMSTRDIQAQLKELYGGAEISATLISTVTNEVMEEVTAWQNRPLDKLYPIVYLDALRIKVRADKRIVNKAFYLALGVNLEGQKELLGIWVSSDEGAKFWLGILTELKNRGLEDIFVACVDGLTGFPEAIEATYPRTQVQLCIVHMIRNSVRFVSWKDRKAVCASLKTIYGAKTLEEAELALLSFSEQWDGQYPHISKSWQAHWNEIIPFFDYPKEIRKAIYTTNAIESLNASLRKVLKHKRCFPSDDAAIKQLYLGLKNISKKWTMPIRDWNQAMNYFMILFEDRLTGLV